MVKRLLMGYTYLFFYAIVVSCFLLFDWSDVSVLTALLLLLATSFVADFFSGLWHITEDFYPLNYKKGFDKIFYYKGNRGSKEFLALRDKAFKNATIFEKFAYKAKIHHKKPTAIYSYNYNKAFLDHAPQAFVVVLIPFIFLLSGTSNLFLLFLVFSAIFFANTEVIHICVHGSPKLAWGWGTRIIRFLQKFKLVYSYDTHKRHHQAKGTGFCFITGHANILIDPLCKFLLHYRIVTMDEWRGRQRPVQKTNKGKL